VRPVATKPAEGSSAKPERVVLARFGAAHGVRGEVRLKSYTERPLAVIDYGPLEAADGRTFRLKAARPAAGTSADMLVVVVEGVTDRNAAERLNGIELSVPRDRLPATGADDFYHADLVGLVAATPGGEQLGTVIAVQNHGAGDLLEIASPAGAPILVPFTKANVPTVDIAGGRLIVDPPPGLLDTSDEETP
jgi:16S rRNA processing protein RimM